MSGNQPDGDFLYTQDEYCQLSQIIFLLAAWIKYLREFCIFKLLGMMKYLIILGDGMADHPVERLGGKTLLQYAGTPNLDFIARNGRTGILSTIPAGFHPGSEVANTAILGYDLNEVYEGRGPLEAASIGYEMQPEDLALRCNIITIADGKVSNHHGGHLTTEEGDTLIKYLDKKLGNERVRFITGIQYRHLLVIKGGNKHLKFAPPHDHPEGNWKELLVRALPDPTPDSARMTPQETADLINDLIAKSQTLLEGHPLNTGRQKGGKEKANSIWPWGAGYRPRMKTLVEMFPQIKRGAVISAVDLIRGIGRLAGLRVIEVEGITGQWDTNYEGKTRAALEALKTDDFVFLHIESSDEAGHDGDLELKLRTIENLDRRVVGPVLDAIRESGEDICVAVLPDHPTPVEVRTHVDEPVPFAIWHPGIAADSVERYDEASCRSGVYGHLRMKEFMKALLSLGAR